MHHHLFEELGRSIRVAILETPAGFELNSADVAAAVGDFLRARLTNFSPSVSVIPARRRDDLWSTNDPKVLAPLIEANYIFAGAGSPTYMARHLKDTLAYEYLLGRHRQGAAVCFASAAAIAAGAKALPVYEIYKAGIDPYWAEGLNFFGCFGLELAIVSHWNNREGGEKVDTSHCFVGRKRLESMRHSMPTTTRLVGIDEHTGLLFDFQKERCEVLGKSAVTVLSPGKMEVYQSGAAFPITMLGQYHLPPDIPLHGPPVAEQGRALDAAPEPSAEVLALIQQREAARRARNWVEADALRQKIAERGFEVQDTPGGPRWQHLGTGA